MFRRHFNRKFAIVALDAKPFRRLIFLGNGDSGESKKNKRKHLSDFFHNKLLDKSCILKVRQIIAMKEKHIQLSGIILTLVYGIFIVWLYWAEPKNLAEVSTKAQTTIENVATKGQIVIGTYEVDKAKFADGLNAFRQENFIVARDNFEKADPERRDAKTQFYIAYSFYRQGFGKVYNDDELFKKGLQEIEKTILLDKNFKSDDNDLKLKTPVELKNELEEGLKVTASDFNPFKVLRERK